MMTRSLFIVYMLNVLLLGNSRVFAASSVNEANLGQVTTDEVQTHDEDTPGKFSTHYFGILYGPSLQDPSSYQPTITGQKDLDRPVIMKNFLWINYNITDEIGIAPSAYFLYQPVLGQQVIMQDPYIRLSHLSVLHNENFNLYADIRWHIPVTLASRESDLRTGIQTYQVASYQVPESRFGFGMYLNERVNFYGNRGNGNDSEFYAGPNMTYQLTPTLQLTMLYEMSASHTLGDPAFHFNNEGTDFEPGISWDISQNLNFNPYLNFTTGGSINLRSTSVGALVAWKVI